MSLWLVEARLRSHLGIDRARVECIAAGLTPLRPRVLRRRRLHASLHLLAEGDSGLEATRRADAALARVLDPFWEIGWETEVVADLG
ncbi:MAG TPA: hypothetical protein VFA11_11770 [Acidimicrobiales bacterium]|nr:hypothetical protein [Acidimicrobiales bacterium]